MPDRLDEPKSLKPLSDDIADVSRFSHALLEAAAVMARLRTPGIGCEWDLAQSFATIAPYTIEEAYEVADAISRGKTDELASELGDLLFQVLFHARMAEEAGLFDLGDVARGLAAKMIRRHPHVFGDAAPRSAEEQLVAWEDIKARERAQNADTVSALDGVAVALPALTRAEKLTKRAARIGFDWPNADQVLIKLEEELGELAEARASGDQAAVQEEFGDVMFVMANLARKLGIDPEAALRDANAKFTRRFQFVEARARETPGDTTLDHLERFWDEAKAAEKR